MLQKLYGIPLYPLFQALTVAMVVVLAKRFLHQAGIGTRHALGALALYLLANFVAAKVFYDVFKSVQPWSWARYVDLQHYFNGGFWGWLLAFLPLAGLYPFVCGVSRAGFYRAIALLLPPVIAVQKLACFCSGCCSGVACSLPWAVSFPASSQATLTGVPVHPLQLYDALAACALAAILFWVDRRPGWRVFLLPLFVGIYAAARCLTEFLRPAFQGSLSTGQKLELVAIGLALAILLLGRGPWRRLLESPLQIC